MFFRRARLIFFGQVHPRVFVYRQPDFVSLAGPAENVAQVRDWYAYLGIDAKNAFRVRIGQSKVPFSFENTQSSQKRLPMDRADATTSANVNERDMGTYLMWAPSRVRRAGVGVAVDRAEAVRVAGRVQRGAWA